ncbi:MAG: NAD-dependent epimerase/dehydratase family protein [Candidatus Aminicenantes bacterium]|nr:NAD-dependent epimerase/dehydratase family protein [Candidatus Aminicenantes bacterium]
MTRTAFITGASGFIGSYLLEALLKNNWKVRALSHKSPIPESTNCEIIHGDIGDYQLLKEAMTDVNICFHLASSLGASLIKKDEFFRVNKVGTETVLQAACNAGVKRIVHFSSAGVLGKVQKDEIADEEYPLNPKDIYDKTKLEGERIAIQHSREGMDVVIIRPGWVYGPGDKRTFKLINAIAKGRFILVTRGHTLQTPVYIEDLLHGTFLCTEKARSGEIYHLAGDEVLTVREIVETIASALEKTIPRFSIPLFPVKLAAWPMEKTFRLLKKESPLTMGKLAFFTNPKPLSIQKAKKDLFYSPKTDFKKGMAQTILWYKEHKWL